MDNIEAAKVGTKLVVSRTGNIDDVVTVVDVKARYVVDENGQKWDRKTGYPSPRPRGVFGVRSVRIAVAADLHAWERAKLEDRVRRLVDERGEVDGKRVRLVELIPLEDLRSINRILTDAHKRLGVKDA